MGKKKGENINGWLIIDKPKGMGSTQVVGKTRWLLNAKKNGHAGTLDPFATGILPIAFGEATKLMNYVTDGNKEYEFVIKWGIQTDSCDCEGKEVASSNKIPTEEEILAIIPSFLGKISQVPPIYSAIKINGQRAYNLARKGEEVSIPSRNIEIFELEYLGKISNDESKFRVLCSKGTYVRSLGADIALALKTFGHLAELRRTKCGIFDTNNKILLETLEKMLYVEQRTECLLPIEASLRDIAVIAVSEAEAIKLKQGQGISPKGREENLIFNSTMAAMSPDGLVAIVRIEETKISPIRVFNL